MDFRLNLNSEVEHRSTVVGTARCAVLARAERADETVQDLLPCGASFRAAGARGRRSAASLPTSKIGLNRPTGPAKIALVRPVQSLTNHIARWIWILCLAVGWTGNGVAWEVELGGGPQPVVTGVPGAREVPLVVKPTVGPEMELNSPVPGRPAGVQQLMAAVGGTNGSLIVWQHAPPGSFIGNDDATLRATFLDTNGVPVGKALELGRSIFSLPPAVAAWNGTNGLVAWVSRDQVLWSRLLVPGGESPPAVVLAPSVVSRK